MSNNQFHVQAIVLPSPSPTHLKLPSGSTTLLPSTARKITRLTFFEDSDVASRTLCGSPSFISRTGPGSGSGKDQRKLDGPSNLKACEDPQMREVSPDQEEEQEQRPYDDMGMVRHTHKIRGAGDYGWFVGKSPNHLAAPPKEALLAELQGGDLFIHWCGEKQCQVWLFKDGDNKEWVRVGWGHRTEEGRRLVITAKGSPSFVAESTWEKQYKRRASCIV